MHGNPLRPAPGWLALIAIVLCGAVAPLVALRSSVPKAALGALVTLGAYLVAAQFAFDAGTVLVVTAPVVAATLGTVAMLVARYVGGGRRAQCVPASARAEPARADPAARTGRRVARRRRPASTRSGSGCSATGSRSSSGSARRTRASSSTRASRTTSARSGSPTASCSSPARSTRPNARRCGRTPRSARGCWPAPAARWFSSPRRSRARTTNGGTGAAIRMASQARRSRWPAGSAPSSTSTTRSSHAGTTSPRGRPKRSCA